MRYWPVRLIMVALIGGAGALGCVASVGSVPPGESLQIPSAFGRLQTVLLSPSNRWYPPKVDLLELVQLDTARRLQIEIDAPDDWFALELNSSKKDFKKGDIIGAIAVRLKK